MKKQAKDLVAGDIIPPPSGERKWLWRDGVKRMLTVTGVREAGSDAKGPWVTVLALYGSPYGPGETEGRFNMRPETLVNVQ